MQHVFCSVVQQHRIQERITVHEFLGFVQEDVTVPDQERGR
jgi:hypothetical protein